MKNREEKDKCQSVTVGKRSEETDRKQEQAAIIVHAYEAAELIEIKAQRYPKLNH